MNISNIHNEILPRTNSVTFAIHVYWTFNFRYPLLHAIDILPETPISDIYTPIVTSHNFNFRYPKLQTILGIHKVIFNIQIHTYMQYPNYIVTRKNMFIWICTTAILVGNKTRDAYIVY